MKRIAILVIAATTKPLYIHYIKSYWASLIHYTNTEKTNIDVYLLFENENGAKGYDYLGNNIIIDQSTRSTNDLDEIHPLPNISGVLSKTLFAFELLQNQYDAFFRTNLSSMVNLTELEKVVESRNPVIYSGGLVWTDALRKNLVVNGKVGSNKIIKSLDELSDFPGNTFISGSGFLLGPAEVNHLVDNRDKIRFDLPDDVAIGLMIANYETIAGFSLVLTADKEDQSLLDKLHHSNSCHIRIQHFPLKKAELLWQKLIGTPFRM